MYDLYALGALVVLVAVIVVAQERALRRRCRERVAAARAARDHWVRYAYHDPRDR